MMLAARISWEAPVAPGTVERMLDRVPHRMTAGTAVHSDRQGALGEGHSGPHAAPAITTLGGLAIAGSLHLYERRRLAAVAGLDAASDRELILHAYRRRGPIEMLSALDGDFAFVIWDPDERRIVAARDRFGATPLVYAIDARGVAFASEPKQLAGTTNLEPDPSSVAAFLQRAAPPPSATFFEGVEHVLPSEVVTVSPEGVTKQRYWNPVPRDLGIAAADIPHAYREQLATAVARRIGPAERVVAQLSGGLDSSSIAAVAAMLVGRSLDPEQFHTVSAVFPGAPYDESPWIDLIVASQPFPHSDFTPSLPTLDDLSEDQRHADGPFANPLRDMERVVGTYGEAIGATAVISGGAGDFVVDDHHLMEDAIRRGSIGRWWRLARATSSWAGVPTRAVALRTATAAAPTIVKAAAKRLLPPPNPVVNPLLNPEVAPSPPVSGNDMARAFRSATQRAVILDTTDPSAVRNDMYEEAQFARWGLRFTQPHLDQHLVEFVASIPPSLRPADGRTKALVRGAFRSHLPHEVIDRPGKAIADQYMAETMHSLAPAFIERFPEVTGPASPFVSKDAYREVVARIADRAPSVDDFTNVWPIWSLMLWLDRTERTVQ